jgi:hypothetical protein
MEEEIGLFFKDWHGPAILGSIAKLAGGDRVPSIENPAWIQIAKVQLKEITECFNKAKWEENAVNLRSRGY